MSHAERKAAPKTHCDICWSSPKLSDFEFLVCKVCKVGVHAQCYGWATSNSEEDFVCWACQAVNTTVTVRARDVDGNRKRFTTTERPTECCLCGVNEPHNYHAMHPMFDHHGSAGRQIVLKATKRLPERLAWAHTICANVICVTPKTAGCVFGCTRDGSYEGVDDSVDNSDASSANSALFTQDASIHHFVFCGKSGGEHTDWTRAIEIQQTQLKCYICGKNDRGSYRIPLQCCANDKEEFDQLKKHHNNLDQCCMAAHVGCSIWGRNDEGEYLADCRRVYFFPGKDPRLYRFTGNQEDLRSDPVACMYCGLHASDLKRSVPLATILRYPGQTSSGHGTFISTTQKKRYPLDVSHVSRKRKARDDGLLASRRTSTAPKPTSKAKQGPNDDVPFVQTPVAKRFGGKFRADIVQHARVVDAFDKEAFGAVLKSRRKFWKQKLIQKGLTTANFRELWSNYTDNVVQDVQVKQMFLEIESARDQQKEQGRNLNDVLLAKKAKFEALIDAPSFSSMWSKVAHLVSADLTVENILADIRRAVSEGDAHMEEILETQKNSWAGKLGEKIDLDELWDKVSKRVESEMNYDFKGLEWSADESCDKSKYIFLDLSRWDTSETLSLGLAPPEYRSSPTIEELLSDG